MKRNRRAWAITECDNHNQDHCVSMRVVHCTTLGGVIYAHFEVDNAPWSCATWWPHKHFNSIDYESYYAKSGLFLLHNPILIILSTSFHRWGKLGAKRFKVKKVAELEFEIKCSVRVWPCNPNTELSLNKLKLVQGKHSPLTHSSFPNNVLSDLGILLSAGVKWFSNLIFGPVKLSNLSNCLFLKFLNSCTVVNFWGKIMRGIDNEYIKLTISWWKMKEILWTRQVRKGTAWLISQSPLETQDRGWDCIQNILDNLGCSFLCDFSGFLSEYAWILTFLLFFLLILFS